MIDNLDVITRLSGGNLLGRWNHTFSSRSDTTFQFYFDNYKRTGPEAREHRNTVDFDFTHHFIWGSRQDVIWGVGYRRTWDNTVGTIDQAFSPPETDLQLFNFFVQDTITLRSDRLFLTAGTKVENNYFTGYGIEPSVRLAWTPSKWITLWSAASRADRTPTRKDTGLNATLAAFPDPNGSTTPVAVILFGNPQSQSEHVLAYEVGFPAQPKGSISIDISTFFNFYDHLQSQEPGPGVFEPTPAPGLFVVPITFGNMMYGTTEGGEVSANLKLTHRWSLKPSYAFVEVHLHTNRRVRTQFRWRSSKVPAPSTKRSCDLIWTFLTACRGTRAPFS